MNISLRKTIREIAGKLRSILESDIADDAEIRPLYAADIVWYWGMFFVIEKALAIRGKNINIDMPAISDLFVTNSTWQPTDKACEECRNLLVKVHKETDFFNVDDVLSWVHQYWHDSERQAITVNTTSNSHAKIGNIELVPRTQVYTEKYMIDFLLQNTLGDLWYKIKPHSLLNNNWKYYVSHQVETKQVKKALTEITLIDPACGAGNFLLKAFDMFYDMYVEEETIKNAKDICRSILSNNIYGIDIDANAVKVACASLWIKAIDYAPNLSLEEVSILHSHIIVAAQDNEVSFGSLTQLPMEEKSSSLAYFLNRRYDVVVTNPPYVDKRDYSQAVRQYLRKYYLAGTGNLYAAFILRCLELSSRYIGMITPQTFLFLSSYAALRREIHDKSTLSLLAHLGLGAFTDAVVDTAMFTMIKKTAIEKSPQSIYFKLVDQPDKETTLLTAINDFNSDQHHEAVFYRTISQATDLQRNPLAYWLGAELSTIFNNSTKLSDYADIVLGMKTSDNKRFLRFWWELARSKEQLSSWMPYEKEASGYRYKRNSAHYVRWSKAAQDFYKSHYSAQLPNNKYWKKAGIVFGLVSSKAFTAKILPAGHMTDMAASFIYPHDPGKTNFLLAILNSKLYQGLLKILNPTVNYQPGDVQQLPLPKLLLDQKDVLASLATSAADAAGHLREMEITDRAFKFDIIKYLPINLSLKKTIVAIWMYSLQYILCKDTIDLRIISALNLSKLERNYLNKDMGVVSSCNDTIWGYHILPDCIEKENLILNKPVEFSEAALMTLRSELKNLYKQFNPSVSAFFPENFLEATAIKLKLNPLSVYLLLKEGIETDNWRCPSLEKRLTEDFFSALVLKHIGFSWTTDRFLEGNNETLISVSSCCTVDTLYRHICLTITNYCDINTIAEDFLAIVGSSLESWLSNSFFQRHIKQFKKRPIVWQLGFKTGKGVNISWFTSCYQENLMAILQQKVEEECIDLLKAGRKDDARQLHNYAERLKQVESYKIISDWGIRVNVAPLQHAGLLTSPVLRLTEEKSALIDYQYWPNSFF